MRWWWSTAPQSQTPNPSEPTLAPTPISPELVANPRETTNETSRSSSREETVEQTLSQYLPVFADNQAQSGATSESHRTARDGDIQEAEKTFENLYPESMSCREAFDSAMHCRGPGGQFVNLYRYGEFRQCSEQWSQFWFCMRTRTKPGEVKKELIRDWYRQKDAMKYADKPSSEDVWEQRPQRLDRAFDEDLSQISELPLEDTRLRRRELEAAPGVSAVDHARATENSRAS